MTSADKIVSVAKILAREINGQRISHGNMKGESLCPSPRFPLFSTQMDGTAESSIHLNPARWTFPLEVGN